MARRARTSRPDYSWSNFGDLEVGNDLGANTGTFGTTASACLTPQTLIRTRGRVAGILDTGGIDEKVMILVGLLKVSSDLFAASGGSAPEIFTNGNDEASWIWQGSLFLTSGAEAAVVDPGLSSSIEVDAKSMRKCKPGESLAFVFHAPAELITDVTGTFDVMYYFHCLNQS